MAEGVLFNVAEGIIANLASEALKEIKLPWGVKHELRKLNNTISTIKAVLIDAEEKQINNQVRVWLEKLEDAIYDADNLVDEFRYQEVRRRRAKKVLINFFSTSSNQLTFRLKMAHKIKNIREAVDEIKANKNFHLEERLEETHDLFTTWRVRETHSFVPSDEVIGRDDDKKAILKLVLNDIGSKENVSTISIVGIGGLGKTTLAQLVFNDKDVQNHFEEEIWVCSANVFEVKLLVEKIIKSVTSNSPDQNLDMEQLQNQLRALIDGKRFLLVLDDVWNEDEEKWLGLERLLRGGARGSRVLITTRSEMVAKIAHTVCPYLLSGLDEEKSWSLFQVVAFEKGKEPSETSSLVEVGKEIVNKCKGVPLAIKTIGRLLQSRQLHSRNPEKEWMFFKNNELAKIADQNDSDIIPTLKLSYNNLPSHLKHCFAFCGLFPKNHEIDVQKLIKLWIAQGFVQPSQSQSCLEDVGYEYFMDLLWRSFFQEAKGDELGTIRFCKMHDLMHDLAISVAGNGIIIFDDSAESFGRMDSPALEMDMKDLFEKARHVSFTSESNASCRIPTSLFEQKKIRTFIIQKLVLLRSSNLDVLLSSFKFLRALSLNDMGILTLPNRLGTLKHLRYLDLSRNRMKILPSPITRLHNLQTLILTDCSDLLSLPPDLKNLVNLRHLEMDGCSCLTHMPRGLGELTSLQTLNLFVFLKNKDESRKIGGLGELSRLTHLQGHCTFKLGHTEDVAFDSKAAHLKDKVNLESLWLSWEGVENDDDDDVGDIMRDDEMALDGLRPPQNLKALIVQNYMGVRFCDWLSSLTNLVELELINCRSCQSLPPLHHLSYLKKLTFRALPALEYVSDRDWDLSSTSSTMPKLMSLFQSLEELTISNCDNLKGWWPGKGGGTNNNGEVMVSIVEHQQHQISFPKLLVLYINNCPNLTSMPLFPNLESLTLYGTSSEPLRQTIMMRNDSVAATSTSSFSAIHSSCCFSPLSKLKFLILSDVQDIEFLLMVIGNLSSLESLKIELCLNLALLPDGIGDLSSLVCLVIQDCPYLVSVSEEIGNLLSLETLTIWGCPNLETLPEGLCNLISLQSLTVLECPNLTSLPKGICNLPFLKFVNGQDWMCISTFAETGQTQDYITTSASTGTSYGQIESNTRSSE